MPDTRTDTAISAARHPILLDQRAQIEEAASTWHRCDVLGLDTEFVRERTYRAGLGLVQVSDGETAWLADPLAKGAPPILARLLEDPATLKIFHSASEDLEVLQHSLGALPEPMVDTQIGCALLGQPLQLGYHHAVQWLFGVEVDKDQTRSNWLKRPLSERQLQYAAMDVVLLPDMWSTLEERLSAAGRLDWLHEEVDRMRRRAVETVQPDQAYLRLGGVGRLDDPELRVLRALAAWREETAIRKDRARGFVINDRALMQLAREQPSDEAGLRSVADIHPRALPRLQNDILGAIRSGQNDRSAVFKPAQLTPRQRTQLKVWRSVVQSRAKALDVDPALLASRRQLEQLLHALEEGREPPERFLGWRREVLTRELLANTP